MDATGLSFLAHAPGARRRIASLAGARPDLVDGAAAVRAAERALAEVPWFDEGAVLAWLLADPFQAAVGLAVLADRPRTLPGERLAEIVPELAGLAVPAAAATYEHDQEAVGPGERPTPLLDHAFRALAIALRRRGGAGDAAPLGLPVELPGDPSWRALLTTVLLFADVAKGGDPVLRRAWADRFGVDGAVHNEESALILDDLLRRKLGKVRPFAGEPAWAERATALVAATGLVGMRLRGEIGAHAVGAWQRALAREHETADRRELGRVWALVNTCDTGAVRTGLWTPALDGAFRTEEAAIAAAALAAPGDGGAREPSAAERLTRLRAGALFDSADVAVAERALASLGAERRPLEERLAFASLWYAEAALGPLSDEGVARLLALLCGTAARVLDTSRPWHLDLLGVVPHLRDEKGAPRTYPTRLLEALLEAAPPAALSAGALGEKAGGALVSFPAVKGGQEALIVRLAESDEARALFTLLPIYERKEAAAFHATLKALCDLYDLRKDEFDRVANEASYLATMNAGRSDKARMLDFVVPGTIVEVGPGGGVVLDLLAERFPKSRVVGLDASIAAVAALERKRELETRRWEVIHGDAFRLPEIVGPRSVDTVVYCSVLHEIFSYVPWADRDGDPPQRFRFGSVAALVRATFRALAPGGRIVVRDGVMPADEPRVVAFKDAAWREGLDLFAKSYEARPIPFEVLPDGRVRIRQPDLYEFLTTFTWGPSSFPYEIREQRAVLPRREYVARLLEACAEADPPFRAREVPVPPDLASYLQPGYPANILPHLTIHDATGEREVGLPDVNGVWVIEKVS